MNAITPPETADQVIAHLQSRPLSVQTAVLCNAIAGCHPDAASVIMSEALASMQTSGPQHDALGLLRDDAQWWAETAPQHEVQEYVYAGMKRLASAALGESARKRFIAALWNGLGPEARKAFLATVAKQGA